jgi:predicted DNA-binding transcriptional regulator YafY
MAKIVKEETEQSLPAQQITPQDLTDHYQSIFRMYFGNVQTLHLRFEKDMLGVIFDRFGEKIEIIEAGDNQFEIEADVAVSVTFFGWLCQFQGKIQIVEPKSIQQEL